MGSFQIQCDTDFFRDEGSSAHQSQSLTTISSRVHAEGRSIPGFDESQIYDNLGTRNKQEMDNETRRAQSSKNLTSLGGLGKQFVNLLKNSAQDQEIFYGKRKPLVDVSAGRKNLQAKAASKKELEKIHHKLSDIC